MTLASRNYTVTAATAITTNEINQRAHKPFSLIVPRLHNFLTNQITLSQPQTAQFPFLSILIPNPNEANNNNKLETFNSLLLSLIGKRQLS